MPLIKLDSALHGDILSSDLVVKDVVLFEAGTVLTSDRIEILKSLGIITVNLEDRTKSPYSSMEEFLVNIDRRFSYVEDKPFMMTIKSWVKEILSGMRGSRVHKIMLDEESIKKLLASQKIFHSVPTIAAPIIAMSNRPDTSIKDLSAIIEKDKELSARLLKIVNSSFYGLKNKVESICHAVVLLGWNATKMVALGSSVLSKMCSTDRSLFNHSMRTAQIARFLATEANFYKVEEIVVVGMLHDFGIMMFELFYPEQYARIRQFTIDKQIPVYIAEQKLTGVDHADIGGWTLEEWNLPRNITESVSHHHRFDPAAYHARKTAIIHVADILAIATDFKGLYWEKVPELTHSALDILGFSESDLHEMLMVIMKMKYEPIII